MLPKITSTALYVNGNDAGDIGNEDTMDIDVIILIFPEYGQPHGSQSSGLCENSH